MKAALFDLDNTLYPEIEFVRGGFRVAAGYLSWRYNLDEDSVYGQMTELLRAEGRGKIFTHLLEGLGLFTEENLWLLVYLYRSHRPVIRPYEDVVSTLKRLRRHGSGVRVGLVTDGMAAVQRRKIAALGVEDLFDVIVCTDELGREFWKPSSVPFKVALALLGVCPSGSVYVGDDPTKDFGGPNEIGMLTIQIDRCYSGEPVQNSSGAPSAAKWTVGGLADISPIIGVEGA